MIIRKFRRLGLALPAPPSSQTGPEPARRTLLSAYETWLFIYLTSLLYVYPYGIPLGDGAIRVPDLLGLACLMIGGSGVIMRAKIRVDAVFLAVVGPFLFLELATPVIGAVGYKSYGDAVSGLRIALLWLPMVLYTLLAAAQDLEAFERRLATLLTVTLWLNLFYGIVEVAVDLGKLPQWMAFTKLLTPFAVDRHFDVVEGLRPAGFFVNTTALSTFAIVALCFFYARHIARRTPEDLRLALLSVLVVIITTSRAAAVAAVLILMVGWLVLRRSRKLLLVALLSVVLGAALFAIQKTIGIVQAFYRFERVWESGILADASFGHRFYETWPAALAVARNYAFGTLISAPRVATLIDSGYLTYYVQGKWLFVASVALMLLLQWLLGLRGLAHPLNRGGSLMLLFVTLFLTIAMIITNPMRSPLVIFFVVFMFWKMHSERVGRLVMVARQAASSPA